MIPDSMGEDSEDLTVLLRRASEGDRAALDQAMSLVYREMRRIAKRDMWGREHWTIQPTAVANEVYMKLVGSSGIEWQNRGQFFAFLRTAMKNFIRDYADTRSAKKRFGGLVRLEFDEALTRPETQPAAILDLYDALDALRRDYPRQAEVLEYRYFTGRTIEEVAETMGIKVAMVRRDTSFAEAWLHKWLRGREENHD